MVDIGERMAAAEADIRNLKESQRDHEVECVRYREHTAKQLDRIIGKQERMATQQSKWAGSLVVVIPLVTAALGAVAKWMGWM